MNESPGKIIIQKRNIYGLSQDALAELVGCKRPKISKLETGVHKITIVWARRLAPHLGLKPIDLLPDLGPEIRAKADEAQLVAKNLNSESFRELEVFYKYLLDEQKKKLRHSNSNSNMKRRKV